MELHSVRRPHHSHLGEEKHQMLNLNHRLETYLGRVKLLEGENELLRQEIQALRRSGQGAPSRRMGLEDELRQARQEVEAAWRERDWVELEVGSLGEELQALGLRWQREADAHGVARKRLAESMKEMDEESRGQIWLREKVSQLEQELQFQIQNHQEEVEYLEATLTHVRPSLPPPPLQTGTQLTSLLDLGQEYSQRATRVWQEAAVAYQDQEARLEESLTQARTRLVQVGQEKSQSQLKLQALEKELASAQDIQEYLEKSAVQQRDRQSQEIQRLQAHLKTLELEKEELGQQIDTLLIDNRGLLQLKTSLGLEVATYRALLDNVSLKADMPSTNQPRSAYFTDAVFSPRGVKQSFQTKLTTSHMTSPISTIHKASPRSKVTAMSASPIWTQKRVSLNETPRSFQKAEVDFREESTRPIDWSTPYPKVLQDGKGSVDHFRPQDVHEEVNYAEPLSPPNEQAPVGSDHREPITGDDEEEEEDWSPLSAGFPEEKPVVESAIYYPVESSLRGTPTFSTEAEELHQPTKNLETEYPVTWRESPSCSPEDSDNEVPSEKAAEKEEPLPELPHSPIQAWKEKDLATESKEAEWVEDESSESEIKAVVVPAVETSASSQASECQADGSGFNKLTELSKAENVLYDFDRASDWPEVSHHVERVEGGVMGLAEGYEENDMTNRYVEQLEDKLYPDGEEMDTLDRVIERQDDMKEKVDDMNLEMDESETQHSELEEVISATEPEQVEKDREEEVSSVTHCDSYTTSEHMGTKPETEQWEKILSEEEKQNLSDNDEDDDDDDDDDVANDSPNASGSWRTELESDSYAQDNTLADTRPLIHYKSDETDANTQASHLGESDSSDNEEDREVGEAGTTTLGEGKSKRFGTMEDLCEESESEVIVEEGNMHSTHMEEMDAVQARKYAILEENADQKILQDEEQSDEETEELTERILHSEADYNEEQENRLVEQELESLSVSTYSDHFTGQRFESETALSLQSQNTSEEALATEQTEFAKTNTQNMFDNKETKQVHTELMSSVHSTILNEPCEHPSLRDSSVEMSQEVLFQDKVSSEVQEAEDAPDVQEKRDEEEENLTHADLTEDHSTHSGLNSRPESQVNTINPDMEESNSSDDESPNTSQYSQPIPRVNVAADQGDLLDLAASHKVLEPSSKEVAEEHSMEEVAGCHAGHEEWEVLDSPITHLESEAPFADHGVYDHVHAPSQSFIHDTDSMYPEPEAQGVEDSEKSPNGTPEEAEIFQVESEGPPKTNSKDLHSFLGSSVNSDLWGSPLETGATYQPDDSYEHMTKQSNQNLALGDSLAWGDLKSLQVANGNTEVDIETAKPPTLREEEQIPPQVKQMLCRDAMEDEVTHSEDSEEEGESWSSGEE